MQKLFVILLFHSCCTLLSSEKSITSSNQSMAIVISSNSTLSTELNASDDFTVAEGRRKILYRRVIKSFFEHFQDLTFDCSEHLVQTLKSYLVLLRSHHFINKKQFRRILKIFLVEIRVLKIKYYNKREKLGLLEAGVIDSFESEKLESKYVSYWLKANITEQTVETNLSSLEKEYDEVKEEFIKVFIFERGEFLLYLFKSSECALGPSKTNHDFIIQFKDFLHQLLLIGYVGLSEASVFMMAIEKLGITDTTVSQTEFVSQITEVIQVIRDSTELSVIIDNYLNYFNDIEVKNLPLFISGFESYLKKIGKTLPSYKKAIMFELVRKLLKQEHKKISLKHLLRNLKQHLNHHFFPEIHFIISLKRYARSIGIFRLKNILSLFKTYTEEARRYCLVTPRMIQDMERNINSISNHLNQVAGMRTFEEENSKGVQYVVSPRKLDDSDDDYPNAPDNFKDLQMDMTSTQYQSLISEAENSLGTPKPTFKGYPFPKIVQKFLTGKPKTFTIKIMNFLMLKKRFFVNMRYHTRRFWMFIREHRWLRPSHLMFVASCLTKMIEKRPMDFKSLSSVQFVVGKFLDKLKVPSVEKKLLMSCVMQLAAKNHYFRSASKFDYTLGKFEDNAIKQIGSFIKLQMNSNLHELKKIKNVGRVHVGTMLGKFIDYYRKKNVSMNLFFSCFMRNELKKGNYIKGKSTGSWVLGHFLDNALKAPQFPLMSSETKIAVSDFKNKNSYTGLSIMNKLKETPIITTKSFKTIVQNYFAACGDMKFSSFSSFRNFFARFVDKMMNVQGMGSIVTRNHYGDLAKHFDKGQFQFGYFFSKSKEMPPTGIFTQRNGLTFADYLSKQNFHSFGEFKRVVGRFVDSMKPFAFSGKHLPMKNFFQFAQPFMNLGTFSYNSFMSKAKELPNIVFGIGSSSGINASNLKFLSSTHKAEQLNRFIARFNDIARSSLPNYLQTKYMATAFKNLRFQSDLEANGYFNRAVELFSYSFPLAKVHLSGLYKLVKPCMRKGKFSMGKFLGRYKEVLITKNVDLTSKAIINLMKISGARSFTQFNHLVSRFQDNFIKRVFKSLSHRSVSKLSSLPSLLNKQELTHTFAIFSDRTQITPKLRVQLATAIKTVAARSGSKRNSGIFLGRYVEHHLPRFKKFESRFSSFINRASQNKRFDLSIFFVRFKEKLDKIKRTISPSRAFENTAPITVIKGIEFIHKFLGVFADTATALQIRMMLKNNAKNDENVVQSNEENQKLYFQFVQMQDNYVTRPLSIIRSKNLIFDQNPLSQLSSASYKKYFSALKDTYVALAKPALILSHYMQEYKNAYFGGFSQFRRFIRNYLDIWKNHQFMRPAEKHIYIQKIFTRNNFKKHRFDIHKVLSKMRLNFLPIGSQQMIFDSIRTQFPNFNPSQKMTSEMKKELKKVKLSVIEPLMLNLDISSALKTNFNQVPEKTVSKFLGQMKKLQMHYVSLIDEKHNRYQKTIMKTLGVFPLKSSAKLFAQMLKQTLIKERLRDNVKTYFYFKNLLTADAVKRVGPRAKTLSKIALKTAHLLNTDLRSATNLKTFQLIDSNIISKSNHGFGKILLKQFDREPKTILQYSKEFLQLMSVANQNPLSSFKKSLLKQVDFASKKLEHGISSLIRVFQTQSVPSADWKRTVFKKVEFASLPISFKRIKTLHNKMTVLGKPYNGNSKKVLFYTHFYDKIEQKVLDYLRTRVGIDFVESLQRKAPFFQKLKLKELLKEFDKELLTYTSTKKKPNFTTKNLMSDLARIVTQGITGEKNQLGGEPSLVDSSAQYELFNAIRTQSMQPLLEFQAKFLTRPGEGEGGKFGGPVTKACCLESWNTSGKCDCEKRARYIENDQSYIDRADKMINIDPIVRVSLRVINDGVVVANDHFEFKSNAKKLPVKEEEKPVKATQFIL